MSAKVRFSAILTLGVLSLSLASSHAQEQRFYSRDTCVKVKEGKGRAAGAFLRDVTAKLAKVRVDAGTMYSYSIAQAVSPVGRSARCDYHLLAVYQGFPPEAPTAEQNAADMKKAGLSMTREAMLTQRDEIFALVGVDVWIYRERVGTAKKGGYARINYDKIHPGMAAVWGNLESNGWKQLAEAASKEHGTAWRAANLVMPTGANLPYNAMTVDIFPSWAALGKGIPTRELWNKVHPDTDISAHLNRLSTIRDRPRVEVVRLNELITK